ncbi:CarD family transcriptional regulator [Proteinivorax hydrogeniformans]|uniref:CarD family transcriptional regulator n=1 Tax=Proteinivorax hydrogeniformans TaxID=1826727 RepID=A0AAU8HU02_9FIRM
MFSIGDKIVYPMHGAGTIENIEERKILDKVEKYYELKIPIGSITAFVPISRVEKLGIRKVVDVGELKKVFEILNKDQGAMSSNWNRRYRQNLDKLKTGDIFQVAEVVKDLTIRDTTKGLSSGEKRMLEKSRQILVSEIVLAKNICEEEADNLLQEGCGI